MNFELPPVGGIGHTGSTQRTAGAGKTGSTFSLPSEPKGIPATPPASVLEEMQAASEVADKLQAQGRELHFALDDGRLSVQLRDLSGNVLSAVTPSKALEIAAGAPLD